MLPDNWLICWRPLPRMQHQRQLCPEKLAQSMASPFAHLEQHRSAFGCRSRNSIQLSSASARLLAEEELRTVAPRFLSRKLVDLQTFFDRLTKPKPLRGEDWMTMLEMYSIVGSIAFVVVRRLVSLCRLISNQNDTCLCDAPWNRLFQGLFANIDYLR